MVCLRFLLWKQQTTNDGYMTTCPELDLQPNSFPGSTNRLAKTSEDTLRVWEGAYTL